MFDRLAHTFASSGEGTRLIVEANTDAVAVDELLKRAALALPAGDRAYLVEIYPRARAFLQRLRMVEARFARPEPRYPLDPQFVADQQEHREVGIE
jgi:hypothetical protein